MTATDVAMDTMGMVEGVTPVYPLPPKFVIEPSVTGLGSVTASASKTFVDTNLKKDGKVPKSAVMVVSGFCRVAQPSHAFPLSALV